MGLSILWLFRYVIHVATPAVINQYMHSCDTLNNYFKDSVLTEAMICFDALFNRDFLIASNYFTHSNMIFTTIDKRMANKKYTINGLDTCDKKKNHCRSIFSLYKAFLNMFFFFWCIKNRCYNLPSIMTFFSISSCSAINSSNPFNPDILYNIYTGK